MLSIRAGCVRAEEEDLAGRKRGAAAWAGGLVERRRRPGRARVHDASPCRWARLRAVVVVVGGGGVVVVDSPVVVVVVGGGGGVAMYCWLPFTALFHSLTVPLTGPEVVVVDIVVVGGGGGGAIEVLLAAPLGVGDDGALRLWPLCLRQVAPARVRAVRTWKGDVSSPPESRVSQKVSHCKRKKNRRKIVEKKSLDLPPRPHGNPARLSTPTSCCAPLPSCRRRYFVCVHAWVADQIVPLPRVCAGVCTANTRTQVEGYLRLESRVAHVSLSPRDPRTGSVSCADGTSVIAVFPAAAPAAAQPPVADAARDGEGGREPIDGGGAAGGEGGGGGQGAVESGAAAAAATATAGGGSGGGGVGGLPVNGGRGSGEGGNGAGGGGGENGEAVSGDGMDVDGSDGHDGGGGGGGDVGTGSSDPPTATAAATAAATTEAPETIAAAPAAPASATTATATGTEPSKTAAISVVADSSGSPRRSKGSNARSAEPLKLWDPTRQLDLFSVTGPPSAPNDAGAGDSPGNSSEPGNNNSGSSISSSSASGAEIKAGSRIPLQPCRVAWGADGETLFLLNHEGVRSLFVVYIRAQGCP